MGQTTHLYQDLRKERCGDGCHNSLSQCLHIVFLRFLFFSLFIYRQFALGCVYICVHVCLSTLEVVIALKLGSLVIFSTMLDPSFSLATIILSSHHFYRNPNLGLTTKTRACKGVGKKGSLGVTSHIPKSVRECEGMNLHTPKWALTLGTRILMDSQLFRQQLQGSKLIRLEISLYH
jgi:hypothetical protein